ncbi:hypothetical protein I5N29_02050 [Serratia marcescens]|nr:hypothetical protein [Serratia marcescens]
MSDKVIQTCSTGDLYENLSKYGDVWLINSHIPDGKSISDNEWYYPKIIDNQNKLICTYLGEHHRCWFFHENPTEVNDIPEMKIKISEEYLFLKSTMY